MDLNHRDTEVTEKAIERMTAPGIFHSSSVFSVSLWFTIERAPGALENLKIGMRNGRWTTSNRGVGEKREKAEKAGLA